MPLNINLQQILLHLLNFTILFAVLYFVLYKPVKDFMEKREALYESGYRAAEDAKNDAEKSKAEYEGKLAGADEEVRSMRDAAKKDIEAGRQKKLAEAEEEASDILKKARESAESEREKIVAMAQADISKLVADAAEKLALDSTASDAYDQFLDAAEASEGEKGHD